MSKKYKILLVVAAIIYVIYHLATLIYSPLPWFDEISFTSITNSYLNHRTFYEEARIIVLPDQKLDYGPVYFMLQAGLMKLLGFTMFHFRLTSLVFGFIDLFLIYKICRHLKFNTGATIVTLLLVALEPNFNQFLHSGRMDFVTLFFFFLSYLAFVKINEDVNPRSIVSAFSVGILLALAILTTPRIIFAFSFYVCYFIYEFTAKSKDWKALFLKYLLVLTGFAVVYGIWIYSAFGSINNFIYYYTHSAVIKEHTGIDAGGKAIKYNLFIYLFTLLAFGIVVAKKWAKANINLVLFTVPLVLSFVVIVTGALWGRYFALVAPFTYLLIGGVVVGMDTNRVLKYVAYTIPCLFAMIFVFKGAYIAGTLQQHDPHHNEAVISRYLSKDAVVAGDFRYYYIARNNNCNFLSLEENGPWEDKMKYFFDHKVNYFIISKDNPNLDSYDKVLLNNQYQLVTKVDADNNSGFFHKVIQKLPYKISENYSCYIYKYIGG